MKIAVTSSSFAAPLRRGAFTQPEWLEACASRLGADGVVFALADFPRTDFEYVAHLKKMAVDLGLVPLALDVPGLLDPARPEAEREAAVPLAAALGVSLLRVSAGPPGELPPETFARTTAAAKSLAKLAKAANVTVVLNPVANTLVATAADGKQLATFVDSAWLRLAAPAGDPDRAALGPRTRILIETFALESLPSSVEPSATGWLLIEGDGGEDPFAVVGAAITALRRVEARERLAQAPPAAEAV